MFRQIIWFYQRVTRGFDERVMWSLDHHLASLILPRLKAFKEYDRHLLTLWEEGMTEEEAIVAWDQTLDKMIYAFECLVNEDKDMPEMKFEKTNKEFPFKKMTNYEEYKKALAVRDAKIEEGLLLFAKHFRSLWD